MGRGLFNRIQDELEAREKSPGLNMSDQLTLPEYVEDLLNWMMRQEAVGLGEVAARLGQDEEQARAALAGLVERGYVREVEMRGMMRSLVRLAVKRGRKIPANLWKALEEKVQE